MVDLLAKIAARAGRMRGRGLDVVIPPEIKDDAFYRAIVRVASTPGIAHILEIGSSSGAGSTEAFVTGIRANADRPALHCIEISAPRYEALVRRYAADDFVHCYRASSVPLDAFPSEDEVVAFYGTMDSKLRSFPLDRVIGWLRQDIEYVSKQGVPTSGIRMIAGALGIEHFDVVLIDGSEFTGIPELQEVYGAGVILLDDICTYKNFSNFQRLSKDPGYRLVESSETPRNGYAVFERVS